MPEALIFGASGGIGAALVTTLKARGWKVYAAARDESRIPDVADTTFAFEAGKPFTFSHIAMMIAQESDGLDLVVYAAGSMQPLLVDQFDGDAWAEVFAANLGGAQQAARASIPLLREGGHFMAIGAYTDKLVLPKFGAYAAAKSALATMLGVLAKENRRFKFTVVRPGAVDTGFWSRVPFSLPKSAMQPAQVAEAIAAHVEAGGSGTLDL
ncbi:MAG: SDR family NAD(P)-dependent oxidoreductase [Pleurocapsa minor GSE-CHR-MK-17-07R]|nr:SDR family NAD(P)-dependent oxidoreductase [Pleurocapsa minor GSE-CHR-MK 17-07R]